MKNKSENTSVRECKKHDKRIAHKYQLEQIMAHRGNHMTKQNVSTKKTSGNISGPQRKTYEKKWFAKKQLANDPTKKHLQKSSNGPQRDTT